MAEDAGKKNYIREFLQRVANGLGFIEDIWVEREVREPGSEGEFNLARSFSKRPISNITELLLDDLRHTFDRNLFTFRFISARPGGGKTAILDYLCELIAVEPKYRNSAVVVRFPFNELLSIAGNESFGVKFYSYALTQTFWELMRDSNASLPNDVKLSAEKFLGKIIAQEKVAQLKLKTDFDIGFIGDLTDYLLEKNFNFKKVFFSTIKHFSQNHPQITFVYLIDELDSLPSRSDYLQDVRSVVRDLINEAANIGRVRLMVYMVGKADDVDSFIDPKNDKALYSRVFDTVVTLTAFRTEECDKIRKKIEERIEGAYSGCKDFDKAKQEISNVKLEPSQDYNSLREFCKKISSKFIEIHEKYFSSFDESFNKYENRARQLVETKSRQQWAEYLGDNLMEINCTEQDQGYRGHTKWRRYSGKSGYELLVACSTTSTKGKVSGRNHAVDCYTELWHNGHQVAAAYGEAKNYALTKEHIDTFHQWLIDFDFDPFPSHGNPSDLALMIAPSCTPLQLRKLKIKGIQFVEEEKIIDLVGSNTEQNSSSESTKPQPNLIDLNNAEMSLLKTAFKGTKISSENTFKKLIKGRPYKNLEELVNKMGFSNTIKTKLQTKLSKNEISF